MLFFSLLSWISVYTNKSMRLHPDSCNKIVSLFIYWKSFSFIILLLLLLLLPSSWINKIYVFDESIEVPFGWHIIYLRTLFFSCYSFSFYYIWHSMCLWTLQKIIHQYIMMNKSFWFDWCTWIPSHIIWSGKTERQAESKLRNSSKNSYTSMTITTARDVYLTCIRKNEKIHWISNKKSIIWSHVFLCCVLLKKKKFCAKAKNSEKIFLHN